MKKIVVIGGGAGAFVVLSGLRDYTIDISAIVTMMDSGGSTGRLRTQYDVLPPGDVRQCLVALSKAPELWAKLFLYRFSSGDLRGHNFGNILLTVLEKITDNYQDVVDTASFILQTKGKVIPVTFDKVHLCVEYEDGEIIETEKLIDTAFHKKTRIKTAYLKPAARANKNALKAIAQADYIIVGPGDLYTSLIPNLIVNDMKPAIQKSSAEIVAIVNLMTKRGQTPSYTAQDYIIDLETYLGRRINTVLINNTPLPQEIIKFYRRYREIPVVDEVHNGKRIIRADLLSDAIFSKPPADRAIRSLIRHDSAKLGSAIMEIIAD